MKNKFIVIIFYILIFFNSNLSSNENNNILKIGLLAPLSGEYKDLGNSLLYSLQLALEELGDKDVFIVPRDSGLNDAKKLNSAIKEIKSEGVTLDDEKLVSCVKECDVEKLKDLDQAKELVLFWTG